MWFLFALMTSSFAWTEPADASTWYVVNDSVMGGVSTSTVRKHTSGGVLFSGELSLDNNGGFVSTRTEAIPSNWNGVTAIKMRIEGDGRRYIATVRTQSRALRRIYYRQAFDTQAGKETEIELPIEQFQAYSFGRRVPNAPDLWDVRPQIGSVGIMLADKQPGPFSLRIVNVSSESTGESQTSETMQPASIDAVLMNAIDRGVPLYNQGDADRCADIYETALLSVLLLTPQSLTESQRERIAMAIRSSQQSDSQSDRAWVLRRGIDATLAGE